MNFPKPGRAAFLVASIVGLLFPATVAQGANFWKNGVTAGDWSTGSNWSATSAAGVDDAGAPTASEAVNIVHTDGTARTVTYDVNAPTIGLLSINLMGAGATTNTLSMPSDNNLTANGIYVGGYNGSGATTGRGAIDQTAGTVATGSNTDLVVSHGAGSTGVYTLSGGALVANQSEFIGFAGTGTFNHSAGTNTVNASGVGSLDLGGFSGATGTYNLSGAGALTVNAHEYVGDSGTGFFNHTGGTNTIVGAGRNLYLGFGATGIGEYVISGTATLSAGGNVIVGNNGTGALVIQDQASVFITNSLTINSSVNNLSTVNLNGGTLRFNTISGISRVNYTSGTIQLAGNRDILFDAGLFDFYGASRIITAGKGLKVEGTTTIRQDKTLTVSGGTFTSQGLLTLGAPGFSSGDLIVNSGGTVVAGADVKLDTFGFASVSGAGSSWTVVGNFQVSPTGGRGDLSISNQGNLYIGNTLSIGSSGSVVLNGGTIRFNGYSRDVVGAITYTAGTVQLAGNRTLGGDAAMLDLFGAAPAIPTGKALIVEGTATIAASAPVTLSGGTLSADTVLMTPGSRLTNTATTQVSGAMLALAGSVIDATGANLTVGHATKVNGFYGAGTLQVGQRTVTLADANDAVLDSAALVTLGAGGSAGTLTAANGLTLDFGGNLTGFGTVSTPDNIAKPLINNGHITGDSVIEPITLPGYVKGVGTFDNVNFTGTFSPGFSPALTTVGSIAFTPTNTLIMELGGTNRGGQYDAILASGNLAMGGAMNVMLIDGFNPAAGHTFNLFDWATTSGAFASLSLPMLAPGLAWNTSQLYTTGVLTVTPGFFEADFDEDGDVDGDDLTRWRNNFGLGTTHMTGDADADNDSDGDDFLIWQRQLGSHPAVAVSANVPEPTTSVLAVLVLAAGALRRRRLSRPGTHGQ